MSGASAIISSMGRLISRRASSRVSMRSFGFVGFLDFSFRTCCLVIFLGVGGVRDLGRPRFLGCSSAGGADAALFLRPAVSRSPYRLNSFFKPRKYLPAPTD